MKNKASFFALIPILYFSISGGPFGLEELVSSVGPFYALALLLVVPILWSFPEAIIIGELAASYPVQGGYYKWVKMAMGDFWGFMEGWWSILYTLIDLSLYPVLVTTYLQLIFPTMDFWLVYLIQLLVIWSCALINILGIRVVGNVLYGFQLFIFLLFVFFCVIGADYIEYDFSRALYIPPELSTGGVLFGLSLVFWNYIGLDGATTVLGEIENPKKNYFKGLMVLIPIIVGFYFFPILVGVCIHQDWASWQFGEFTYIAETMNLKWSGIFLVAGGVITFLGLFNSLILTSTRVLSTMSDDGFLPKWFSKINKKSNVPQNAIIFAACAYSVLVLIGFHKLVVYDVFLFLIAMFLEAIAVYLLKIKRNKKLSLNTLGGKNGLLLAIFMAGAVIILMTILQGYYLFSSPSGVLITLLLVFSGIPAYKIAKSKSA